MDDIAENYGAVVSILGAAASLLSWQSCYYFSIVWFTSSPILQPAPVNNPKKKLSQSDSLSLPPTSPVFKRNPSKGSRGYSPFSKRRSRADTDTPPSSNTSVEDVKQRVDDSESSDNVCVSALHLYALTNVYDVSCHLMMFLGLHPHSSSWWQWIRYDNWETT